MSNLDVLYKEHGFSEIEKKYSIHFKDKDLLVKSFIHPSYDFTTNNNYQRLEFLGDAVLQVIVSDYLYKKDERKEGVMSKERALLVSKNTLNMVIEDEDLKKYVQVGKSVLHDQDAMNSAYIADIYESFVAAIYLDQGFSVAKDFVYLTLLNNTNTILEKEDFQDYKTKLQEILQVNGNIKIIYDTKKNGEEFVSEVKITDMIIGKGYGNNKKEAEQKAAKHALEIRVY